MPEEVKHAEEISWGEASSEGVRDEKIQQWETPEEQAKESEKDNSEELFKKGVEEFKKGKFQDAVDLFRQAVDIDSEKPQYWSYLSLSLSKVPHKMKEAEDALLKSIKLEPLNGEHYANLGSLYLKAGLHKRASGQFEKALKFDPRKCKGTEGAETVKGK